MSKNKLDPFYYLNEVVKFGDKAYHNYWMLYMILGLLLLFLIILFFA